MTKLRRWRLEAHRDTASGRAYADQRLEFHECEPPEEIKAALVKTNDKGVDALTEPEHQGGCGRAEGVDALRKTMKLEEIKAALVKAKDTVSSASGSGESETLLG